LDRQKWFHSLATEFTRLNTVRLFFMGLRERDCFATEPTTPDDMQNRIHNAMALMPEEMLRRTTLSLQRRLRMCLAVEGDVFEHLL